MSKSVPTAITLPKLGEVAPGKPVYASTWTSLVAAQNYIYGRQGVHVGGCIFDPPWYSLDYGSGGSSYHSVGTAATGRVPLNRWQAIFRFSRPEYNTTATAQGYRLTFDVYARNLTVRASIIRLNTEDGLSGSTTTFSILTNHAAAQSEWDSTSEEFTPAEASRSGSTANGLAYFLVYVEALVPSGGTGIIHQFALRESPITSADNLPRGSL